MTGFDNDGKRTDATEENRQIRNHEETLWVSLTEGVEDSFDFHQVYIILSTSVLPCKIASFRLQPTQQALKTKESPEWQSDVCRG